MTNVVLAYIEALWEPPDAAQMAAQMAAEMQRLNGRRIAG